ncbi:MAG: diguanylate cyclase [Massilia sp.]
MAAPTDIADVLEQQRQHGFVSPAIAADQLASLSADLPAAAPELRMRYHAALAALYIAAENPARTGAELDALEEMAVKEKCVPCGQYHTLRQAQQAIRMQKVPAAQALQAKIEAISSTDPNVMQAVHYVLAGIYDATGRHARAIDEGLQASKLAIGTGNTAEQVRTLNLLMLSNIGRRDLTRAESLSREAYELAERIGFVYMMAYIRGNSAWLYSLKGEPAKQLAALNDVLSITRAHEGLGDSELVALVNLAEYHAEKKSFKQALDLSQQAIALADKQNKPVAKGVALVSLGRVQAETGDSAKGIQTLQQSIALLNKAGAKSYVIDATNALADVYERSGKNKEALGVLHSFIALKEEASHDDREKAIAEAQEKFSGERKDNEIVRLSLESSRRQAEIDARAWQQRLWATVAVALALGAALLIQMIKRARNRNRLLEDSNAVLSDQSVHDPLTGVFNRRHCVALMGQQQAQLGGKSRDRNYRVGVGLMLLDVDHFKRINDTWGHAAGDAVLVDIAQRLQALVRQHDVVVRWGGEEFVLVLPGTSADGMTVLAERALKIIGERPVMVDGKAIPVTMSAGCVSYPLFAEHPWEDALKIADVAMYMAKEGGRNRAVCLISVNEGVSKEALLDGLGKADSGALALLQTINGPAMPGDASA